MWIFFLNELSHEENPCPYTLLGHMGIIMGGGGAFGPCLTPSRKQEVMNLSRPFITLINVN